MASTRGDRPPHPLGPGVVLAVPDVPAAAGRPARRACSRSSRPTRPTPTSCSTGRWRWSTTTSRSGPRPRPRLRAPGRHRPAGDGPWYVLPDEFLVSGETIVRDLQLGLERGRRASAAPWRSATCPTCSATSPRCPSSSGQFGFEHAVVWRGVPVGRRPHRLLVGGARRLHRAGRVPAAGLRQRRRSCPTTPRRCVAPHRRVRRRAGRPARRGPMLWMNGTDHLTAPAVAGPGRGRGQRARRTTTTLERHARWPSTSRPRADRGPARAGRASCAPGARANLLMGVASNRVDVKQAAAARRARARAAGRAAVRAVPAGRALARRAARRGLARGHPQRRPRLDLRLLGRRGRATPCCTATPRPARSPTGSTDRAVRGARPIAADGTGPLRVNPSRPDPRRARRARSRSTPMRSREHGQAIGQRGLASELLWTARGRTPPRCCTTSSSRRAIIHRVDVERQRRRVRSMSRRTSSPARHARHATDEGARSAELAAARPDSDVPVPRARAGAARRARPRRRRARLRLATGRSSGRSTCRRSWSTTRAASGARPTGWSSSRSTPPTATFAITDATVCRPAGSAGSSTTATTATPTTTPRPPPTPSSTAPTRAP